MKKIITDSAANLNVTALNGIEHQSVGLTLICGERVFLDSADFDQAEFDNFIENSSTEIKSSCPSVESYLAAIGDADEVYIFTISSALSGSYNTAQTAKKMILEEDPSRKIKVFDTKAAGPAERMAAVKASELLDEGIDFPEVVAQIKMYIDDLKIFFSLQSLKNLANNGRVNKTIAKLAGVLKINVLGWANKEGKIEQLGKARGTKRAYQSLVNILAKHNFNSKKVVIDHANNEKGALALKDLIQSKYPNCQIEIGTCKALCSFYAEKGGLMVGCTVNGEK
ncbi:DegV family protein [Ligilactobacillus salivarius]|uniref:DegV family protein n=1 Tax=Ligilactobacillus salivarius TaxID=1624 RepID=UPI0013C85CBC|nr:DegV family protein [Ligilactobacillus salivarius]MYU97285.1 DegV family protein [Ligilactobacillus salivarius]MYY38675.1 DegV family protein [Ligilactobacillus salivarius]MYY76836.1 DegV family protein [Ligilactobacillus salivarius]MYZ63378.1 DegV family protein [Ligilactobacillus salivarius]